ncbi:hypothetical protein JW698_00955 [Candidatus Wolfebacteria bacterium]|nr:hypothetical protein [Candidatus Wolfebacteria bacterium]
MPKEAQSTQQFVEVEEIKDDVVILKNGSLRRLLMVSGINFELKSKEEQDIITYSYQNFLNTLDFSVQIIIHSRKLNIENYLVKLADRQGVENNELLKNQISEYIEFIRSFVELNAVMAKTFFVVVPYDAMSISSGGKKLLGIFGFGKNKTKSSLDQTLNQKIVQLNQRTEQVISGLSQIGLRAVALEGEELVELFYNLYNPESKEKK